jgi:hypothetical protein
VRSTNTAPVFASDPAAGALGRVAQAGRARSSTDGADSSSYLVRWEAGGESWADRSTIEPLLIGDQLTMTSVSASASPNPNSSAVTRSRPQRGLAGRMGARIGVIVPLVLFLLQSVLPRVVNHPTPTSIALALGGCALLVALLIHARRRALTARPPSSAEIGTTDAA